MQQPAWTEASMSSKGLLTTTAARKGQPRRLCTFIPLQRKRVRAQLVFDKLPKHLGLAVVLRIARGSKAIPGSLKRPSGAANSEADTAAQVQGLRVAKAPAAQEQGARLAEVPGAGGCKSKAWALSGTGSVATGLTERSEEMPIQCRSEQCPQPRLKGNPKRSTLRVMLPSKASRSWAFRA